MAQHKIEIADSCFKTNSKDLLSASSLGSCVGVAIFDGKIKSGGMMVSMLPSVAISNEGKGAENPFLFCDTGFERFIEQAKELGLSLKTAKIVIAGGASFLDALGPYSVGLKNCEKIKELVSRFNPADNIVTDLGGSENRSLCLDLSTGQILIDVWGKQTKKI